MLSKIGRMSLLVVALAAFQVSGRSVRVAHAEEDQGPLCFAGCSAGLLACCGLVEGACYFCITNYNNCINVCNGLTGNK